MTDNQCPYCSAPNTPQAKFCAKCGQRLPTRPAPAAPQAPGGACPRCHVPLAPNTRFCANCGYNLAVAAAPPAPPPAAGTSGTQLIDLGGGGSGGAPTLVIRWPGGVDQKSVLTKQTVRVGRAPDNDVVINHPAVSGHHLVLNLLPGGMTITDIGSTNGTLLNNQRIAVKTAQPFQPTDILRIGDLMGNSVRLEMESGVAGSLKTMSMGKLELSKLPTGLVGRDPTSDVPLNHPSVSFRHAMIARQNGGLVIRDLGSTNGTFVNGRRIMAPTPLQSGDVVQIGPFKLVWDAQLQSLAQSVVKGHRLDAIQLSRQVKDKKWILKDVTMCVQPGDFIALVGGSGAGKSTLMKAMNGYDRATHGQMLVDGTELYQHMDLYRSQMGYVPQDDIIHRELPVRLALWYAAKLRLPDFTDADIQTTIDGALKSVDMAEHQEKKVKDLSGGQRKRVSIAAELLASPTLFYLDEPTSGLDPGLEKKMMYDLNRLADEGRTVVLVTHATANIEQCDYVAFMTWGRLAYYGPPKEALTFFGVQDFSDIYQELQRVFDPAKNDQPPAKLAPYYQQHQQQIAAAAYQPGPPSKKGGSSSSEVKAGFLWSDAFRQSPDFQKYVTDRQRQAQIGGQGGAQVAAKTRQARDSFFRQGMILARRQFDLVRMDKRTMFILLLMMPAIAMMFMLVSKPKSLVGRDDTSLDDKISELKTEAFTEYQNYPDDYDPEDPDRDWAADYKPYPDAKILLVMLGLALTQAGTFGAAYEIVKERAIFKRERAVNLKVTAYVLSKFFVLALFAVVQVVSVILIVGIRIDLGYESAIFPDMGVWGTLLELFIIMYLGVLASIGFGLLISAIVPSLDVVLYAILAQLFVQIVLSATLFPLPANPLSYVTPGYWTMNALGSSADLKKLDDEAKKCLLTTEIVNQVTQAGGDVNEDSVQCSSASARETNIENFKHEAAHIIISLIALTVLTVLFVLLTIVVQARKKID
jgi:ABC-type multidrug transport system ATPase subunit/pSer/pThr/pTyr-binding forkhead associated (FHA) protein